MKTILSTLNAKYIHTSLALRWLYVANKERFDIEFMEFTIKEDVAKIASELLATQCDILGLSVYIWNVTATEKLIKILKEQKPELIIILGGPEVTYEPEHFLKEWPIDYVISGEGEFVLGKLLHAIENNKPKTIPSVSIKENISLIVAKADLEQLSKLPSPYQLEQDKANLSNRMVYFETSRGCPYQCQYCLSSREKGVRYFPEQYIQENLLYLIHSGARQIKFLDRTFNLNRTHTLSVFDFLMKHYRKGLSCQFEVYADLLTDDVIEYLNRQLPEDYFRFEIGIQSTYEPTNLAVNRKQDFRLLAENIQKLMKGGKVAMHLDLIAGLPHETFTRFMRSFNDVFALRAKEVQLGFLKMLRGTKLRNDAEKYGYQYSEQAPYEIYCNAAISVEELQRIHHAEHALEKFWNSGRFKQSMNKIFDTYYAGGYFEFFDALGLYYNKQGYPQRGYQLEDLFRFLNNFLQSINIDLSAELRKDYYNNYHIRPQGYWQEEFEKGERKRLLYLIGQDKAFLDRHKLTRQIVEKKTAINTLSSNKYLLTVFEQEENETIRREITYCPNSN
ncbi:DUF4080 domain-containing protein [Bacteroides sp. 214]|uniref:B12-binding domain-containing radical SAM protein n=1 Tax=Bacteroides sp. 214 TaxID=2302935 RepID=UPI0013D3DF79|nr:B12-binding domain-containing radical SAM protein [Bacteroides sp. 214]NDW12438.1 DUF4080 domain-containing protein [Bacteroides sp. 214]